MRTRVIIAALAAFAFASPAAAQEQVSIDTVRVERARKLLDRAERRWESYDLKGARSAFAQATWILQEQQVYAGPALLSLAYVTYADGRPADAAKVLVEASNEAARFGDVELQAQSLYEASFAAAEAGDRKAARALRAEAQRVMGSGYLPVASKSKLAVRFALAD
jgi:hypothetical protein